MNRTFKFNTLYIGILLLALAFSSCTSSKQLAIQKSKTAQLSRKLGFTVNRKDDLPLLEEVSRWLGTPYRYGGTTRTGADCSGFVGAVYKNVYHKSLQRTVVNIYNKDCQRIGKRRLKPGDLVFFSTYESGVSHSGLYLGDGYFISATSSCGVAVATMKNGYWHDRYVGAKRVL